MGSRPLPGLAFSSVYVLMVTSGGLVVEFSIVGIFVVFFLFGPLYLLTIGLVDVSINGLFWVIKFTV